MENEGIRIRLLKAMDYRSVTPAQLSKMSGIAKSTLSRYLSGKVTPKQNSLGAIASALRVSPAWLLGYSMTMIPEDNDVLINYGSNNELTILIEKLNDSNRTALKSYAEFLLKNQEN